MSWVAVAIGGSALIGGGVAMYEGSQNRAAAEEAQNQYNAQPDYLQLPGYSESDAARGNWWQTLQDWQKQGNYGVNTSIYDDIYKQAEKKINQYYWGSPTGPGAIDKIKSTVAQRGVQDSPATGVLASRMAAEESGQLGDLSTTVGANKANAIETARGNWLNSLTNLSQLKPSFVSGKTGQFSAPTVGGLGTAITTAGTGIAQYMQNQQDQNWYANLLRDMKQPTTTQSSLTSLRGEGGYSNAYDEFADTSNWMS